MLRSELGRAVVLVTGGFFLGGGAWSASRPLASRFLRLSRLLRFVLSVLSVLSVVVVVVVVLGAGAGAGDARSRGVPGELTSEGGPDVAMF